MSQQALRTARILAVDDEEPNLKLMGRVLERAGYTGYHSTTDPGRVLGLFRELQPDLVLLDLHMRPVDGLELLELLRPEIAQDTYLPILMVSGDLTPEARREALSRGAKDFLAKPWNPDEALLRIGSLLETRRLHLEVRMQNRFLEEKVRERTRELDLAHLESLERLARAGEYRDDDTGQHTRRVGDLAAALAAAVGQDADTVEMLRRAAALHDLGKIGIPDGVLLKPGRLTPEERACIETHTTIGAQILAHGRSRLMHLAERIALCHHERWDGAGYPRRLRGDEIPLEARIVALADVFDALSHDRAYRAAWPPDAVLAEIAREAGGHFDPALAAAFLGLQRPSP
ncbi:MAG TPA: HD domain-containing phosphohydrolase, partial [Longimicrobium sp.]|nr:HD domain-containing phosphohydrolase [Longimicrobium sp.]